jgi:hypothetical protein
MYFQDERRFGFFTRNGKALTAKGINPFARSIKFLKQYIYLERSHLSMVINSFWRCPIVMGIIFKYFWISFPCKIQQSLK